MNQQDLSSFNWSVADLLRGDCKLTHTDKLIYVNVVLRDKLLESETVQNNVRTL